MESDGCCAAAAHAGSLGQKVMDKRYEKRMARYWAEMEQKALRSLSSLDMTSWFDLWHTHPDWKGKGNRCPENRMASIQLGYSLLKKAEELARVAPRSIQSWLAVCPNSLDDGVYLHSENPNGTPFPYPFEGVEWGASDHPVLDAVVDSQRHRIGKALYDSEPVFFVTAKMA